MKKHICIIAIIISIDFLSFSIRSAQAQTDIFKIGKSSLASFECPRSGTPENDCDNDGWPDAEDQFPLTSDHVTEIVLDYYGGVRPPDASIGKPKAVDCSEVVANTTCYKVNVGRSSSLQEQFTVALSSINGRADIVRLYRASCNNNQPDEIALSGKKYTTINEALYAGTYDFSSHGPSDVATGDFNGDGYEDLALGYTAPSMFAIRLQNKDGGFQEAQSVLLPSNSNISDLVVTDLNNDGHQDIVGRGRTSSIRKIIYVLGKGDGSFTESQEVILGSPETNNGAENGAILIASDLDSDGDQDLVVNISSRKCFVVQNDLTSAHDLSFSVPYTFSLQHRFAVAVGDIDSDGDQDIIASSIDVGDEGLYKVLNQGPGVFSEPELFTPRWSPYLGNVLIEDIDNNGTNDIVLYKRYYRYNSLLVLKNNNGSFSVPEPVFPFGTLIYQAAYRDMNGDGLGDFVLISAVSNEPKITHTQLDLFIRNPEAGSMEFTRIPFREFGMDIRGTAKIVDLRGDGLPEVVSTSWLPRLFSLRIVENKRICDLNEPTHLITETKEFIDDAISTDQRIFTIDEKSCEGEPLDSSCFEITLKSNSEPSSSDGFLARRLNATVRSDQSVEIQEKSPTWMHRDDPNSKQLESPVYALWNGNLEMTNILELFSTTGDPVEVQVSLYRQDGSLASKTPVVARSISEYLPLTDVIVNDLPGFAADSFGLIKLEFPDRSIQGRMFHYRAAQDGSFDFAFGVSLENPSYSQTSVGFNTYQPSRHAADAGSAVSNWLTLVNLAPTEKQFEVETYDGTGQELFSRRISVRALSRVDIDGGHGLLGPAQVGQHVITPLDQQAPYLAQLYRYGEKHSTQSEFSFASAFHAEPGSGELLAVPVSTQRSADNWLEIVNTSEEFVDTQVQLYDNNGITLAEQNIQLKPFSQQHINAGLVLGPESFGHARIFPSRRNSIIVQSMFYHYDNAGRITSMHGSRAKRPGGTVAQINSMEYIHGSLNLYLGMESWLTLTNTSNDEVGVRLFHQHHYWQLEAQPTWHMPQFRLAPGETVQLGLHLEPYFYVPPDLVGGIWITTSIPGTVIAEVNRVRVHNGVLDFVAPTDMR